MKRKYIVELAPFMWLTSVWLNEGQGGPPRTLRWNEAKRYSRYQDAKCAITWARKHRPFKMAKIWMLG